MDGKEIEKLKLRLRDRRAKIQCNDYLEATVGKAIRDWEMFECLHATLTASGSLFSYNAPQLRHVEISRSQLLHKTLIMGL
jgi:hypothetical protein